MLYEVITKKAIQIKRKAYIGFDSETSTGVHFADSIKLGDLILIAQGVITSYSIHYTKLYEYW